RCLYKIADQDLASHLNLPFINKLCVYVRGGNR
ncbi:unnamed protein product, partial [Rotaria sp. Silwood2]